MRKNGLQIVEIVRFSDISLIGAKDSDVMQQEYARIEKRRDRPNGSYTSNLLKDKNKLIKKFGEEAAELVQASATGENLIGEAIDVFYATDMLLAEANKSWKEVEEEIRRRWK
ncbi:MAG: phosphoribosyl-ATP diphosphatase [bacterium]|nr:phosphoribosyl-ATP diphosphatase [bacterium]